MVISIDPDWLFACAGHPTVGSVGAISDQHQAPLEKTAVVFTRSLEATSKEGHLSSYSGLDDNLMTLYMLNSTLEIV